MEATLTPTLPAAWPGLQADAGLASRLADRQERADWASFDDEQIEEMSDNAPEFWAQWRAPLLAMCAAHASKVMPAAARGAV